MELMLAVVRKLANDPQRLAEFEKARHLAKVIIKTLKKDPFKNQPAYITVAALFLASVSFTDACSDRCEKELSNNEKD